MADDLTVSWSDAIARAEAHAPFLRRMMEMRPDLVSDIRAGKLDAAMQRALALQPSTIDEAGMANLVIARQLRLARGDMMLALALGDLAGALSFQQVARALSDFADVCLQSALESIFARRYDCAPTGFAVIALGKLGGHELNYSSDIDPIFLFDPETMPSRRKETPHDAAQRVGRELIALLSERDGDGHVFRVDMRLRPESEVSPMVLPIRSAISHYESRALTWERAAFIRSRQAAGCETLGQYFLQEIQPFVWRRSLDFGTIDAIGELTRRIRAHHKGEQLPAPGFNLKTGRGGIREIEFFAQSQQLVHGGRNPELRSGNTLEALAALATEQIIAGDQAEALSQSYVKLRTIEHRLQMVEDRQTHSLPEDMPALNNVAQLHGLADSEVLIQQLRSVCSMASTHYDDLLVRQGVATGADPDEDEGVSLFSDEEPVLIAELSDMGFADPKSIAGRLADWRSGKVKALRTPQSRAAFENQIGALFAAIREEQGDVDAINRLDSMLQQLPSVLDLFHLLAARPALIGILARLLCHAPALSKALAMRASLIDGIVDASIFDRQDDLAAIIAELEQRDGCDDLGLMLERVATDIAERRFAIGVQLIEGRTDPLDAALDYSRIAEATIAVVTDRVTQEFVQQHGQVPGGELVILAMGRLGGEALTHASDLDLVYLFTGAHDARSDGPKPLSGTQYFNRLAQRVSAGLSLPTATGPLYEVDTRLRPSGMQGLLAASMESFWDYQRKKAWTWEHMALCRARPVYGSQQARNGLSHGIAGLLGSGRVAEAIAKDALAMRGDMAKAKPPKGPWDAKLAGGALVDLEFCIHTQQLIHGQGLSPHLGQALAMLVDHKLLSPDLIEAHNFLTRLLVMSRLVTPQDNSPAEASRPLVAQACGMTQWDEVTEHYQYYTDIVRAARIAILGAIPTLDHG
ncbi:bifunctional [glutamine synthetase] adenylyltransferase/[glutamine synthetase]-adenylyl-L-tyrosine phosphorylase [Alterisphingorhabdus coralli]|uniref:Bifunctional [glutamine synthetase] adenylyltransferase/[glutamine synthetase]-adenylyl-L-tyrosine phosphorylase n=1 Tax=Alterisphingorhabdus coralli TaxID=3071408 RepID=A0AA97I0U5_9SPHN|nr:bifunctional [glutamine synthetase] adenylyltransferase/[glutamine synthetase]-adenylyl-L-tyrosine phosphorylase [Parasphingorhabdus sp. SCSIO 66989]WOE76039.1 bifunctional [glutamine synthetase] adenylyltransferase/[glutamine synthetase]-adenylyl-L-tyrosine phosphorylase [Parasphingorhabdus sp. SCSIO 66989]